MKFTLEINLGNEAMADEYDLAQALEKVAAKLRTYGLVGASIQDGNGNTIGRWEITGEPEVYV